jgi:hypothetical protein
MLPAMLNRATMRVADTTEVSGRVTADSREKQIMRPIVRKWLALVAASVGLYLVLPDRGLAQQSITLGTLKGTYVTAQSGFITDSSGNLIPITIAGNTTFFGKGQASGVGAFLVPGQATATTITFVATYAVNPDGMSVSETTDQEHHLNTIFNFTLRLTAAPSRQFRPTAGIFAPGFLRGRRARLC